jgi:hypothetical protein
MINWTADDYAEVRKEYGRLVKEDYRRFARQLGRVNFFLILPGAFAGAIYAIFTDQMRYLWLLPILAIAHFLIDVFIWATRQEDFINSVGDSVFVKKVLIDDVVVVNGAALQLALEDPENYPAEVNELKDAVQVWKDRQAPRSPASCVRRHYNSDR